MTTLAVGWELMSLRLAGWQAVLLVYDITNYESFQNLEDWYRLVRRTFDDDHMPYVGLVGNKSACVESFCCCCCW